jgi:hypothetical protein
MKCEEFEWTGLDADSARGNVDRQTLAAAMEHANTCTQCAALLRSWRAAQAELQLLRAATQNAETPARVAMRLRQAVHDQESAPRRKFAMFSAWALATAAVWIAAASWRSWHDQHSARKGESAPGAVQGTGQNQEIADVHKPSVLGAGSSPSVSQRSAQDIYSAEDLSNFTFLPGSVPVENGDSEILRVRLQRAALGALGLPVNEERAGEWLHVDLLVTEDGQPQAVRLAR